MPNPFCHIELSTDDVAKAKKFYKSVFDWKLSDAPGAMPYTMIEVGKGGVGGGMQAKPMPSVPTSWLPYVEVESVKKSLAKAKKAGANIALDFHPIGEMGAIGVFVAPDGSTLGVWEAGKKAAPKKAAAKKVAAQPAKKPAAKKSAAKKR